MDMERKLSNSTFDIDFIMAGLAYVQHSVSENCLQQVVFAAYAGLRGTEIGVNFHILFQSIINITQLGRQDMKLFSTVIFY